MTNRNQSVIRYICYITAIVSLGLLVKTLALPVSIAHADVTKYPRDGRYCNHGQRKKSDEGVLDVGPFFMLDMAIVPTLHPIALCDGDVESVKSFWRSYYQYHGCTADSDAGKSIEHILESVKRIYSPDHDAAWTYIGENPKFCEKVRSKCTVPATFNPDDKDTLFPCRMDELINELRRGAKEILNREAE